MRHGGTFVVVEHLRQRRRGFLSADPHREHVAERPGGVEDLDHPAAEPDWSELDGNGQIRAEPLFLKIVTALDTLRSSPFVDRSRQSTSIKERIR